MMRGFLVAVLTVMAGAGAVEAPELAWSHTLSAGSLYPPVPVSGDESNLLVLTDVAARALVAINAQHQVAWRFSDPAFGLPACAPALGNAGRPEKGDLAVLDHRGAVWVIEAAGGGLRWRQPLDGGAPLAVARGDLDESGADEVLALHTQGLTVFSESGDILWRYPETPEKEGPLAMAVADCAGNGLPNVYLITETGVQCRYNDGSEGWMVHPGEALADAVLVADVDADALMEVYALNAAGTRLWAWDADTGECLRQIPLTPPNRVPAMRIPGSASAALLAADFNHDEQLELIVSHATGRVALLDASGALCWTYTHPVPACLTPILCDSTADGGLDIVVAASGGALFALDEGGDRLWTQASAETLFSGPVCTDLDKSGQLELYVQGGDGYLRAYPIETPAFPPLFPWPFPEGDPARSRFIPAFTEPEPLPWGWENRALLPDGNFENAAPEGIGQESTPGLAGWLIAADPTGRVALTQEAPLQGKGVLRMEQAQDPMILLSEPVVVDNALRSISGVIFLRSEDPAEAALQWFDKNRLLREDVFRLLAANEAGWRRGVLGEQPRPVGARSCRLALRLESGVAEWDAAQLEAVFERLPKVSVRCNQLGYDLQGPKTFTAWASFKAKEAVFSVLDRSGQVVFRGELSAAQRIEEANGYDWGGYYYRGKFTQVAAPGGCSLRVRLDGQEATSPPFTIAKNLLWERLFPALLRGLEAHRCGVACHLDDSGAGQALVGGWHEGSRYDKGDTPAILWELLQAYQAAKLIIDAESQGEAMRAAIEVGSRLLENAVSEGGQPLGLPCSAPDYWGAAEEETDHQPASGDERVLAGIEPGDAARYAAALARSGLFFPESATTFAAAEKLFAAAKGEEAAPDYRFSAAMDLWRHTHADHYKAWILKSWAGPRPDFQESGIAYGDNFDENTQFLLITATIKEADAWIAQSENPFGLAARPQGAGSACFPEGGPNSEQLLEAALLVAKAYRYNPVEAYLEFIYDQLNWLLGNNPSGQCLISGFGETPTEAVFRMGNAGALPEGLILNGLAPRIGGSPAIDLSGAQPPAEKTNGYVVRNSARCINVLAHVRRVNHLIHFLQETPPS